MKIRKIIIIVLGIVLVCVPAYFILMFWSFSNMKVSTSTSPGEFSSIDSDTLSGIDRDLYNIDDNLPYRIYKKKQDSLEHIQQLRKRKNILLPWSDGWQAQNIGLYKMKKYPSAYYYSDSVDAFQDVPPLDTVYYLGLNGYTLKYWEHEVYRENGKDYMKYVVWDSAVTDRFGQKNKRGHYVTKEIPITVAELPKSDNIGNENQKRMIYIPLTQKTSRILNVLFTVLNIFLVLWWIISVFIMPIRVLQLIAKGDAFAKKTVRFLHIVSFSLLGFYAYHILSFYVVHLFVAKRIPPEFKYSLYELFTSNISFVFAGIAVLAIAIAFRKGTRLQEEQELTV